MVVVFVYWRLCSCYCGSVMVVVVALFHHDVDCFAKTRMIEAFYLACHGIIASLDG